MVVTTKNFLVDKLTLKRLFILTYLHGALSVTSLTYS